MKPVGYRIMFVSRACLALLIAYSLSCGDVSEVSDENGDTVAMPAFSPSSGTYNQPIAVEITTDTDGARIYYTTNGSNPSEDNGDEYDEAIVLEGDGLEVTLRAIAVKEGLLDSEIAEATYIFEYDTENGGVATPVFTPAPGIYDGSIDVEISTSTSDAIIHYTMDGSKPSKTTGEVYDGPIELEGDGLDVTIRALGVKEGMLESEVAEASYAIEYETVATPVFDPEPGVYDEPISVDISTATGGATIYYTMDGSEPSEAEGTVFLEPIILDGDISEVTIRSLAIKEGMRDSEIASATYEIDYHDEFQFLKGVWATKTVAVADSVTMGVSSQPVTTAYSLVHMSVEKEIAEARAVTCHIDVDTDTNRVKIFIKDSYIDALDEIEYLYSISGDEEGYTLSIEDHVLLTAVDLQDPLNDEMPDDKNDPRFFNQDGRRGPGITIDAWVDPVVGQASDEEMSVATRQFTTQLLEVKGDDLIVGSYEWDEDRIVLETTHSMLDWEQQVTPRHEDSYTKLVKVDDSYDCEKILAEIAGLFAD